MNTKEAIRILLEYISHKGDKWEVTMTIEDIVEFKKVIELLKCGEENEKYKAIYNDLEKKYKALPFSMASGILLDMRNLKQKYYKRR